MEIYLITLKDYKYSNTFLGFLQCHNIRYEYLDDLQVYKIRTTHTCAQIIKQFSYVNDITKDEIISVPTENIIVEDNPNDSEDKNVEVYEKTPDDWGAEKINAPYFWLRGITGKGINVGVLDLGITDHRFLDIKGREYFGELTSPYGSHGTAVAGIIGTSRRCPRMKGVAFGCNLYDINVGTKTGTIALSSVITALEWCIDNNIHVVNLSFGQYASQQNEQVVDIYRESMKRARDKGIIIVASSGNNNTAEVKIPAQFPAVFGIGAIDINNQRWNDPSNNEGSNYGRGLNFVAPGVDVLSTDINDGYSYFTGTSMSAPFVTGLIALLLSQNKRLTFTQIRDILEYNSLRLPIGEPSPNMEYGYGLVQTTKQ